MVVGGASRGRGRCRGEGECLGGGGGGLDVGENTTMISL